MSGNSSNLKNIKPVERKTKISGFDSSTQEATHEGTNQHGLQQLIVPGMGDLTLYSARDFADRGAVILMKDSGQTMNLSSKEQSELKDFIKKYKTPEDLTLKVVDNTYEVVDGADTDVRSSSYSGNIDGESAKAVSHHQGLMSKFHHPGHIDTTSIHEPENSHHVANSNTTRFFNAKVSYDGVEESVVGMILSGFSLNQQKLWRDYDENAENWQVTGIDPRVRYRSLERFEKKHGRTPDILRIALPNHIPNKKSHGGQRVIATSVGDWIEIDGFYTKWNTPTKRVTNTSRCVVKKIVDKAPTLGGATVAFISVDAYSQYIFPLLRNNTADSIEVVKSFIKRYETAQHHIKKVCADQGVLPTSMFRVMTSDVIDYLMENKIMHQIAEPHNHSNGTPLAEVTIRWVKTKMNMAFEYAFANEHLTRLGYLKEDIISLWGEIFHWATAALNCHSCPNDKSRTRYEIFWGVKPNLQKIRFLPIFSVVLIWRTRPREGQAADTKAYVRALYVGPDFDSYASNASGSIRVFVKHESGKKSVICTSKYTHVNQGGESDVLKIVYRGMSRIMNETNESEGVEDSHPNTEIEEDQFIDSGYDYTGSETEEFNYETDSEVEEDITHYGPDDEYINKEEEPPIPHQSSTLEDSEHMEGEDTTQPFAQKLKLGGDHSNRNKRSLRRIRRNKKQKNETTPTPAESTPSIEIPSIEIPTKRNRQIPDEPWHLGRSANLDYYDKYPHRSYSSHSSRMETPANLLKKPQVKVQENSDFFYDVEHKCYVQICEDTRLNDTMRMFVQDKLDKQQIIDEKELEELAGRRIILSYKAVKGPGSFTQALESQEWGPSSRSELEDVESKVLTRICYEKAMEDIRNGADLIMLFPVYEEKMRDGALIRKVRLVGDGSKHTTAGNTYSETPTREDFLLFLNLTAIRKWNMYHIDESRAFLNSPRQDTCPLVAKIKGIPTYWNITGALYGLRTSTKDHAATADARLRGQGFIPTYSSKSVYKRVKLIGDKRIMTLCFRYVDDYFFTGNDDDLLVEELTDMKSKLAYSDIQKNPKAALGMDVTYDHSNSTISLAMPKKIEELRDLLFKNEAPRHFRTPLDKGRYIISDADFESETYQYGDDREYLDKEGINLYMKVVGSLVWINGIRFDICFVLTYLTWFSNKPRRHHLEVAKRVAAYLLHTKDIPLVIGGVSEPKIYASSDASLSTGPKGKSIIGSLIRLNPKSGAIRGKSKAMLSVALSSFEGEVAGLFESFRHSARLQNFWAEIDGLRDSLLDRHIESDNNAAVNWICGRADGSGIKHAVMKYYYMQDEYNKGGVVVQWVEGTKMVCDAMTKAVPRKAFESFRHDIQGLGLLFDHVPAGNDQEEEG
jgi:hypothetical protein